MKDLIARREQLLQQMARCDTMEYGSLQAERRSAAGGGFSRPYYKHQVWEAGRNASQRIPAEEAAELEAAIANRHRFEALAREFMDVTVQWTRRRQDTVGGAKKNVRRWRRPSLRKSSSS
jgi:mannitol-1-phosphate/altronate dehydrogenase